MEQGVRLLIQLVLELTPVIATLIQKRNEDRPAVAKYLPSEEIKEFIQSVSSASRSISHVKGLEQEKFQQQQLAFSYQETQLKIATQQREIALKLPEVQKVFESWPLRLSPSQILESQKSHQRTPLKIFLAPPKIKFDKFDNRGEETSDIEFMLAEGLREFLNQHYSLHNPVRPTEFLAGAWDSKRFHSESSIKALFGMLKTEPILILESEADGDYLNFRIGYWGLGQDNYYYQTMSRFSYKEIVYESAISRARKWKIIRDELIALGENLEEINHLGGENVINLAILEKAEKWKEKGIDISELPLQYQINRQDIEKLCQVLIRCHILAAGWVADAYHLVHHDVPPRLPELLASFLTNASDSKSLQAISGENPLRVYAAGYKQLYQALEMKQHHWIPDLALELARVLSYLSDDIWAKEQLDYSLNTWLQMRQVPQQQGRHPLVAMQSAVKIEDQEYIEKLKEYFAAVDDSQNVIYVEELLNTIAKAKDKHQEKSAYLSHTLTGHSDKVTSVAICPDGQTLVSGCVDKTIKIWNLTTGKVIRTLTGNIGEVSSIAISPDGNFLVVGSCEHPRNNVKVWHLATGKLLHTLLGHQKPVNSVVISPDGQILASGSNKIKIWNLHKGDRICTLWHSSAVYAAAISPDGTILASGSSDHKIRLWNPMTGELLRTFSGHSDEVKAIAISPNGEFLISGSLDKTIKIWHLNTSHVVYTLSGHSDEVKSVVVSPDGQTFSSASADKTIKIWSFDTGELLQTLTGHSGAVNSIVISPDNRLIVSGSSDKTIKIWQRTD
ncbi:WD40 repeat domain-containing protein [Brasilonema sp. UFV-L1]|uniref:WD40 repeat domain-containing protein n=1 Tax=Brasilonema sp. UFV-L1 TaxID=2234130 RepID=UPI00145EDE98|nr:WD40 repeat domain-containing protein [Brasilonema sp. UFV-L1]NMG08464.1 WD40 repeat domain-containing protein [Brasilonema sp. UFV-L1]